MICTHCGKKVADDSLFCNYCGERLKQPISQAVEPGKEEVGEALYRILNEEEKQNENLPPFLADQMRRGADCDQLPGASGRFGYDPENPIPCNGPLGEMIYLSRLRRGKNKEKVFFHRLGSLPGNIDRFELMTLSGERDVLYVDMYHPRKSRLAPEGYTLMDEIRTFTGVNECLPGFPLGLYPRLADYTRKIGLPVPDEDAVQFDDNPSFYRNRNR